MEKTKEYTSEEQQWLTENRLSRFQKGIFEKSSDSRHSFQIYRIRNKGGIKTF